MAYFMLRLNAPRPSFPFDATAAEQEAMGAHAGYWQEKVDAGAALAVGPVFDPNGAFGLALVEVKGEEEARALSTADPVIAAGLGFSYDILPVPSLMLRRPRAGTSE